MRISNRILKMKKVMKMRKKRHNNKRKMGMSRQAKRKSIKNYKKTRIQQQQHKKKGMQII